MRNIYDISECFFAAYAEMGRSKDGLKAAGEWHQLQNRYSLNYREKSFGFRMWLRLALQNMPHKWELLKFLVLIVVKNDCKSSS